MILRLDLMRQLRCRRWRYQLRTRHHQQLDLVIINTLLYTFFSSESKTHHFLAVQALKSPDLKIQMQQSWKTLLESERQLMLELAEKK
jgi:hypothetical protein